MPKVSIIVPIYNVEEYLKKCLDSLIEQSLQDIEIILVNDGSTDGSKEIAIGYQEKYSKRIKYIEKANGGLSDARNYGIPYATGEYIAFLDSDDYVDLHLYQEMYTMAKKENADMVESDFYWVYPDKKRADIGRLYEGKNQMIAFARVVAWNKLIKREIIEKTQIKFPKGLQYEDVLFFYQLAPYIEKVAFLKKPMIYYMQRENSISKTQNEKTAEIFQVLDQVLKYYKENNLYDTYQIEVEYNYARYLLCSSLLRMVKIKEKSVRKKLLKENWEKLNKEFPHWKKNKILKKEKSANHFYMKTVNHMTYPIYCKIFEIL